jgi:hypothetical protein
MIFNKEETRNLLNMLRSSDKENAILAFESLKKVDIKTYIGELIVLYKFGNASPEDWETNCSKCVKALGKRKILTGAYNALSSGVCLAHMTNNNASIQSIELFMEFFTESMIGFLGQMGYPADKFEINIKIKDGQSTES